MDNEAPTSGNGDASASDPIDRIEAFLAAQGGDETGDADNESDQPKNAAKTPDDQKDDAPAKDEGPQFTTAHLAQYLGVDESEIDVDEDGQPVFKTKIDGKESTAKFADLRKTYQLNGHAENRAREVAAKEAAAERKLQEAEQQIAQRYQSAEQQMQGLTQLTQIAQQELQHDYNQVNWTQLWQEDPGRAGILEKQFQARNARIQNTLQSIQAQHQHARAQLEQHQKQTTEATKAKQQQRLMELIPDWKDREVASREVREITAWLEKSGIDQSEIDFERASSVFALRRAWQHDTLQASKPAIEKKLREAPKLVKPGTAQNKSDDGNSAQLKALKQKARGTGGDSTKAAAAWLMANNLA